MPTVKHIIKIYFDYDRPDFVLPQQWVVDRFKLFSETTLQSILGQTFRDFDLWIICGNRNEELTRSFDWHPRCERIYDLGKAALEQIGADFVAITRMDSDDLMHRDAMREVADNPVFYADRRRCTIFRKSLAWSVSNKFIGRHYREDTPFVTQFIPRCIYKDFDKFLKTSNVSHGRMGGRDPDTIELSENKICVVKHAINITTVIKGRDYTKALTDEQREKMKSKGQIVTDDPAEMLRLLEPFGVKEI